MSDFDADTAKEWRWIKKNYSDARQHTDQVDKSVAEGVHAELDKQIQKREGK
jgi:hypothetical protein